MGAPDKQISLKPQDLLVALKMACHRDRSFTYAQLGAELRISASEAHSSLRRLRDARLVFESEEGMVIQSASLREFVQYGARYCFPATTGAPTRGVPTGYAAAPLRDIIVQSEELPPVWPHPSGPVRGIAIYPLYRTVPDAVARDGALYECLALFDALRAGAARERELAIQLLGARL
jgi:hypothetical protein